MSILNELPRAQRAALQAIQRHGYVWAQSRGRWAVSGTNGAEASAIVLSRLESAGLVTRDPNRFGHPYVLTDVGRITTGQPDEDELERERAENFERIREDAAEERAQGVPW